MALFYVLAKEVLSSAVFLPNFVFGFCFCVCVCVFFFLCNLFASFLLLMFFAVCYVFQLSFGISCSWKRWSEFCFRILFASFFLSSPAFFYSYPLFFSAEFWPMLGVLLLLTHFLSKFVLVHIHTNIYVYVCFMDMCAWSILYTGHKTQLT